MHDKSFDDPEYEELEEEMGPAEEPRKEVPLLSLGLYVADDGLHIIMRDVDPVDLTPEAYWYLGLSPTFYKVAYELLKADYEYLLSMIEEEQDDS